LLESKILVAKATNLAKPLLCLRSCLRSLSSAALFGRDPVVDRALHHAIQCFAFNFKEGNFLDFNPKVSALSSAKVVSANMNKRKSGAILPPGTSGLQAGLPLIRRQPPIALLPCWFASAAAAAAAAAAAGDDASMDGGFASAGQKDVK
jgi:hypothetical protein